MRAREVISCLKVYFSEFLLRPLFRELRVF
jgi:hypothetical protein